MAGRGAVYVFDLLGPARTQSYLPAPLRSPYLVPLYGIEVWRPLEWDRRRALARATVIFSISAHTLERARPFVPGLNGAPVLPLALEERRPEGAVDAPLLGRLGRGFFLIVGRMDATERYKGHDQLLEALRGIPGGPARGGRRRRRPPPAGGEGGGSGDGRPRRLHRLHQRGDPVELYRRCAVFAMPSRGEGFGLVYLEAMRAGKPVLAARGSAAGEIVVDGATGLLVDPDDREELRSALGRLLDYPGEARRMGEAGFERWRRELGVERFRERLGPCWRD